MRRKTTRREVFKNIMLGSAAFAAAPGASVAAFNKTENKDMLKGNIKHSVCRWTYDFLTLDELCQTVKDIGFAAIDLIGPKDWDTLKKHGIYSSMCNGAEISLTEGWNDKQYHPTLVKNYTEYIDLVSKAGYKNLICFSGNRKGMDDQKGLKNSVDGLKKIVSLAEKKGVV
ncbi:MAG TPA: hypothetical protein VKA92_06610, partial [Segetibacter sp.]|nr:hypothetical protein [Segetibacter sp.]